MSILKKLLFCNKKRRSKNKIEPSVEEGREARVQVLKKTMAHILEDRRQMRIFERFLETEYCVNWIKCWRACSSFEKKIRTAVAVSSFRSTRNSDNEPPRCKDPSILEEAYNIYLTFLSPQGKWFIGASGPIAENTKYEILTNDAGILADIFYDVKLEIFEYLANNKLERFALWLAQPNNCLNEKTIEDTEDDHFVDSESQNSSVVNDTEVITTVTAATRLSCSSTSFPQEKIPKVSQCSITSDDDILSDLDRIRFIILTKNQRININDFEGTNSTPTCLSQRMSEPSSGRWSLMAAALYSPKESRCRSSCSLSGSGGGGGKRHSFLGAVLPRFVGSARFKEADVK